MKLGEGSHQVTVTSTALQRKNDKGQIVINARDAHGNTATAYLFLTDAAWPYTQEKLATLGWDVWEHNFEFDRLDDEPSPIAGNQVEFVIENTLYEGKIIPKVAFINAIGGVRERMPADEAKSFAAQLRSRLMPKSSRPNGPTGTTARPQGRPINNPQEDDTPPF